MDSQEPLPMPIRNYAEKVKAMLKKASSVQREPPRCRLDIHIPSCAAQTNLTKKIQKLSPRSNHKSPRQSLAVSKTRGLAAKVSGKPIVVRPEPRSKNNRSIRTGIPIQRIDSPGRKSHVASIQTSKVSEEKVLAADISGAMLLEDYAKSEIDTGECSSNFPLRIPLDHTQISDNRTKECSFDDIQVTPKEISCPAGSMQVGCRGSYCCSKQRESKAG